MAKVILLSEYPKLNNEYIGVTDFCILTGADALYNPKEKPEKTPRCYCWTDQRECWDNIEKVVCTNGKSTKKYYPYNRFNGICPAINLSLKYDFVGENIDENVTLEKIGYYPKTAVNKLLQNKLEKLFNKGLLHETRNVYTTDLVHPNILFGSFIPQQLHEYEYKNNRYVRVIAHSCYNEFYLSNKQKYNDGDAVWVKVEPIQWYYFKKYHTLVSKNALLSGIQFYEVIDDIEMYKYALDTLDEQHMNLMDKLNKLTIFLNQNFEKTNMGKYLNEIFLKEIMQIELENYEKDKSKCSILVSELVIKQKNTSLEELSELLSKMKTLTDNIESKKADVDLLEKKYLEVKEKEIASIKRLVEEYITLETEYERMLNSDTKEVLDPSFMIEEGQRLSLVIRGYQKYIDENSTS